VLLPSVAVLLLLPTLLDGVERKIRAIIHSRIGPPITQSWLDVLKLLFEKELFLPPNSLHTLVLMSSSFTLQVITAVLLFNTLLSQDRFSELIAVIVLYAVAQTLFVLVPFTIPNPFSVIGASREVALMLINEAFFLVFASLYLYQYNAVNMQLRIGSTLCIASTLVGLLINSYVASARVPFDIAEAEPELASGLMIELSGPLLGVFLLNLHLRRFFTKLFVVACILMLLIGSPIILVSATLLLTIALWIAYAVIAVMLGRSRVDLAPITLLKIYIALLALSVIGCLLRV